MLDRDEQQLCPSHTGLSNHVSQADSVHLDPSAGSSRGQGDCSSQRVGQGQGVLVTPLMCRSGEDKGQERWSDPLESTEQKGNTLRRWSVTRGSHLFTGPNWNWTSIDSFLELLALDPGEEGKQNCRRVLSPSASCPRHVSIQGACKCLLHSRRHRGSHWQACLVPPQLVTP